MTRRNESVSLGISIITFAAVEICSIAASLTAASPVVSFGLLLAGLGLSIANLVRLRKEYKISSVTTC